MRDDIEVINEKIYHTVNNGVYKSGFATSKQVYEEAVTAVFETLEDKWKFTFLKPLPHGRAPYRS